jgi:hypothetical protein
MAVKVKKKVAAKKVGSKAKAVATKAKKPAATKKPAAAKKSAAAKPRSRAVTSKGDSYVCEECGLIVFVDETCDCVGVCDIICCDEPMTLKKARSRS